MAVTAFASPGTYTAAAAREAVTAGLAGTSSTTDIRPRNGIFPDGVNPFAVSPSSGMTVSVKPGQAAVAGWVFSSDTAVPVTLATSGATARTDLVILRIQDEESGDGVSAATIEVVTGTSTAVPALPSSRCLVIAQIAVPATVGSITGGNITDRRVYTAAAGGIIPASGALASAPTVPNGTAVFDAAANRFGVATNGAWRTFVPDGYQPQPILYAPAVGGGGVTNPTNTIGITTGITLPAMPYDQYVQCNWMGLVSLGGSPTDVVDLCLWRDGATLFAVRGYAERSIAGSAIVTQPAGTAMVLQLVAVKVSGTTPTTFSNDRRYTNLTALAIPVVAAAAG